MEERARGARQPRQFDRVIDDRLARRRAVEQDEHLRYGSWLVLLRRMAMRSGQQHGTPAVPNDCVGYAPEQRTGETGAAMRRHHDQVDVVLVRVADECVGDATVVDSGAKGNTGTDLQPVREIAQGLLGSLALSISHFRRYE